MKVEEVMAKEVWTCRAEEPSSSAAERMWEHDVGALPVMGSVVGSDQELVGIVTDRDLCMAAYFAGKPLRSIPVADAMSKVVFTIEPWQSVEAAEELLRAKQIRRLPVVSGRKLAGMITLGDLARASFAREPGTAADEVTLTLAAVTEPRSAHAAAAA